MSNSIVSPVCNHSQKLLNELLSKIKNSETPNYYGAIQSFDALQTKNDYQQQVLDVIKWFDDYYSLCNEANDEKEFILQHLEQIIESAFPKKVLDTLWLLHYYKLHKSQNQLDDEFLTLKRIREKNKEVSAFQEEDEAEDNSYLDREPYVSIEPYLNALLKNEHCKSLANILAVLNINQLLTEENLKNLFKQSKTNYELLEKCLVKLSNKFLIRDDFKFLCLIEEKRFRLDKTESLEEVIRTFSQEDISVKKYFLLLDKLKILTSNNINTIQKYSHEEIRLLLAKIIILTKNNNALTENNIDLILKTLLTPLDETHRKPLAELIFLLNEKTSFLTESNTLLLLKLPIKALSELKNELSTPPDLPLELALISHSEFFTKENLYIIFNQCIKPKEHIYQVLSNLSDLSPKNCIKLRDELVKLDLFNNESKEMLRLGLITLLEDKSGLPKLSMPSAPETSITPDAVLSLSRSAHSATKHLSRNAQSQQAQLSVYSKLSSSLTNLIKQLIKKWWEPIETSKHKKLIYQEYQQSIKKLSEQTDINQFAHILCDVGLLYRRGVPLPKKNPTIDQLIKKFSSTNPQQTNVLVWLNSYYRNGEPDEKGFIQQQLGNILNYTKPKKALHAISMLYFCGLHAEEEIKGILASDKTNYFITLFLEKLDSNKGAHIELLKKEIKASLQQLKSPAKAIPSAKTERKTPEITKEVQLEIEDTLQNKSHSESKQAKHGSLFSTKTSKEIRDNYNNRVLGKSGRVLRGPG